MLNVNVLSWGHWVFSRLVRAEKALCSLKFVLVMQFQIVIIASERETENEREREGGIEQL